MSEKQVAEDEKKEVEDKYLREQARFATLEKEQEDLLVCMGKVHSIAWPLFKIVMF